MSAREQQVWRAQSGGITRSMLRGGERGLHQRFSRQALIPPMTRFR